MRDLRVTRKAHSEVGPTSRLGFSSVVVHPSVQDLYLHSRASTIVQVKILQSSGHTARYSEKSLACFV